MLLNVALNWLLIEPHFGLPGHGVVGSATASVIATWVGFLAIAWVFLRDGGASPKGLRLAELRRVLRFGLPNGVNWLLEIPPFNLFINAVVGHHGTTALAAFNIVIQINRVSFMPAFGLASAGAILAGEAIGRGAKNEVGPIVRMTGAVAAGWMAAVGGIYFALPEPLVGMFQPRGGAASDLLVVGASMLGLSAIWQIFDAAGLTLSEALRAAGDTLFCMVARIVLAWAVFIPSAFWLVRTGTGGTTGIILCMAAYIAALALTFGIRFASGGWKRIELVEEAPLP
jgi:MATE family multidrug resistance protein